MMRLLRQIWDKVRSRQISITWKIFLVTAIIFIVFILAWIAFQSLFLEKIYSAVKETQSIKEIQSFCDRYSSNNWDRAAMDTEISRMSDLHDLQIVILNEYGNDKHGGMIMLIKDADGREISTDLHDVRFIDILKDAGLKTGAKVKIFGVFDQSGSMLYPYKINVGDTEWKRDGRSETDKEHRWPGTASPYKNDDMVQLEGTVEYLRVMSETEYVDSSSPFLVLKAALKQWQDDNVKLPSQYLIREYNDTVTGTRYKMLIIPFSAQDGSKEAVFAIVPLQPLDEAIELIKNYMWVVFLAALVLVSVLSFIFYRMVTKPLIQMNKAAIKMSHMDFNTQCEIHTHDELGSLSSSLNIMSTRLDSTITELKEFVSNASHELKTPIAVIGGYAEALKDDIRKDKRDRYIDRLQQEAGRMNLLVQDMLDLSRMESDSIKLKKEIIDLYCLAKEVLEEFSDLFQEKHIKPILQIEQDSAIVIGDHIKLRQVIQNFISNALIHTPLNGMIWITAEKHDDKVTFMIENEGIHISEEKINKIWDRFYRVEASRSGNSTGTGLGLAISAKILQLHHANYGATNTERGVMFFFSMH
ncbi:MAG: HAMP domain-containing histidine kinase [Clostridiaceae bacterium]|nr:HAMP domain-containing histidine kinase [Clostridiaceae bacterium]